MNTTSTTKFICPTCDPTKEHVFDANCDWFSQMYIILDK